MNHQELEDGKEKVEEARELATKNCGWSLETKEKAVAGVGMISSTEGDQSIVQNFLYRNEVSDETFKEEMNMSWKEYIESEFESNFNKEYKKL